MQGVSKLQNEEAARIEQDEAVIAGVARDYFEKLGKGWDSLGSDNDEMLEHSEFRIQEEEEGISCD